MAVIGKIRERVGLLVFIIALAILAFLLMDVATGRSGGQEQPVAGTIDGQTVNYSDYQTRVQQTTENRRQSQPDMDEATRLQIREQAWNNYVREILSTREFEKLGIEVTNEELTQLLLTGANAQLQTVPLFQNPETKQFDRQRLEQYVASFNDESLAPNERESRKRQWLNFEKSVIQNQKSTKYSALVNKAVYAPEWLAKQSFKDKNRKANVNYVFIPYDNVPDTDIEMTDSDLKKYINNHKEQFKQDAIRKIDYVVFPIQPSAKDTSSAEQFIANNVTKLAQTEDEGKFLKTNYSDTPFQNSYFTRDALLSDPKIKDSLFVVAPGTTIGPYFETGAYKVAKLVDRRMVPDSVEVSIILKGLNTPNAQKIIDSLKNVLDAGGDFSGLASAFSDDTGSKENGGNLGYLKPAVNQYGEEFVNAVFYEHKKGDVFTLKTPNAWQIIKIENATPSSEAVKVAFLSREIEASKETVDSIFSVANRFAGTNRSLEEFTKTAAEKGWQVQSISNMTQNYYNIPNAGASADLATWAFRNDVGDVCDKVLQVEKSVPGGKSTSSFLVAAIKGASDEGVADLENVRTLVEIEVKKEKKAEKLKAKVGTPSSLDEVVTSTGQELLTAEDLTFDDPAMQGIGAEPKVQAVIFGSEQNVVSKPIAGNRGVYVVQVTSFTEANDPTDLSAAKTDAIKTARQTASSSALSAITKAAEVEDERYKIRRF